MLTKEQFLDELLKFNTGYDTDLIGKAYDKAKMLHEGQFRKSGEPYFIHPIAVAIILAGLGMDEETARVAEALAREGRVTIIREGN